MNWYGRAHAWAIGSDPGLLRLRSAVRITATLGCALLILFLLTRATGQPVTVAVLGMVIAMIAARSVNEPDPRQQKITLAALPVPAVLAVTLSALLVPYRVAGDVVFVLIIFAAVYARRFGARGTALGMVTFMAYFFTLFLHSTTAELPWLFIAVVVGAGCSLVITAYLLPDRPERVLGSTMRSLRARMSMVVDTAAEALRTGQFGHRRHRRLAARTARLNETTLMAQTQIEDKIDPAVRWPGVQAGELTLRLLDAELAIERVAGTAARAAAADLPAGIRTDLAAALTRLAHGIRTPQSDELRHASDLARQLADQCPGNGATAAVHHLASAIVAASAAVTQARKLVRQPVPGSTPPVDASVSAQPATDAETDEPGQRGLLPTTRQAIQVAVAASAAIVAGELVSPARWYWAVIATFVIFAGTSSWEETLTKGWQRLLGTVLGVPSGVLVATAVSGHTALAVALVFGCLFCAFYLMKVSYSLMMFWITTMLALLYGMLGQFDVHVLVLRIEETAIGAVIGVAVAILVLPTNTAAAVRRDARTFLTTLRDLIQASTRTMSAGDAPHRPTALARQLDRTLQQFRTTAKPLSAGIAGIAGIASRRSIQRGLRMLTACDHYARSLARASEIHWTTAGSAGWPNTVSVAAEQVRRNVDALVCILDRRPTPAIFPAADLLDTAEARVIGHPGHTDALSTALRALRQIDLVITDTATDLGAVSAVAVR